MTFEVTNVQTTETQSNKPTVDFDVLTAIIESLSTTTT